MPPRSRATPPPAADTRDALADAVAALTDQVEKLNGLLDTMDDRMRVLTAAVDDIRQEFEYAVRSGTVGRGREPRHEMRITSMPKDPLADDFGNKVNRHSANDLPPAPTEDGRPEDNGAASEDARQGELFE